MKKNRKNATLDIVLERLSSLELAKIETKMEIAARIEDEMIRRGWSKGDLMNAVGKNSPSIITSWLSGTHNFTIDTLVELEHALDISL
ncbi:MAG: helix-turn-helix transcriptional regulator, partial [Bacteroidales bacterium]